MSEPQWERVTDETSRLKVDGGYLYRVESSKGLAMDFVPEIDLQRYESHLRDAYNKGYADGQEDIKNVTANV
jgi:hypothetical protein